MSISMSPSAHYVSQSYIYNNTILGPLTNRKIEKYMREGKYGKSGQLAMLKQAAKSKRVIRAKQETRKQKFEKLFANF